MWILPRNLINQLTSVFAPATEALTSDSKVASQTCAQSLMRRSNAPQSSFFLREWKAGNLTRLRSGAICEPSLGAHFLTEWTSFLEVIPANPSAQQVNDSAPTIPVTSGLPSQTAFAFCDPESVFLKTSRGTLRWDSPACSQTWRSWVTKQRGEYSARLKLAHLTNASGCSSWPTAKARDWKDTEGCSLDAVNPDGTHRNRRDRLMGAIVAEMREAVAINQIWQTPTCNMDMVRSEEGIARRKAFRESIGRKSIPDGNLGEQMRRVCGQADPANPSTGGSRQESWPTPDATNANDGVPWEKFHASMMERRAQVKKAVAEGKTKQGSGRSPNLAASVQNPQWATPKASDPQHAGPNMRDSAGNYALPAQVVRESWATPIVGDSHLASTPEVAAARIAEGKVTLSRQNPGKLNPRWVETLLGLPVGWVMASCASPVTIAPTSCECSETESSQQPLPEPLPSSPPTLQQDAPVAPSVPSLSEIAETLRRLADMIERIV